MMNKLNVILFMIGMACAFIGIMDALSSNTMFKSDSVIRYILDLMMFISGITTCLFSALRIGLKC